MNNPSAHPEIAREAKAIVALAFRNRPIESLHAGKVCPTCAGQSGYSKISDSEMAGIMSNAVDHLYALLLLKHENPDKYESEIRFAERYTSKWDEPSTSRRQ
jgi:hypothetical protein